MLDIIYCCGVLEWVNAGHDIHCWNPDDICRVSLAMEPEGKIQKLKKIVKKNRIYCCLRLWSKSLALPINVRLMYKIGITGKGIYWTSKWLMDEQFIELSSLLFFYVLSFFPNVSLLDSLYSKRCFVLLPYSLIFYGSNLNLQDWVVLHQIVSLRI